MGRRLLWQLFASYLVLLVLVLGGISWYLSHTLEDFYSQRITADLQARARLVADMVAEPLARGHMAQIVPRLDEIARNAAAKLAVVEPDGQVVASSRALSPELLDSSQTRPEVVKALGGHVAMEERFNPVQKQQMLHLAVPVRYQQSIVGVVQAAIPLDEVYRPSRELTEKTALGGLLAVVVAALLGFWMASRITRPLQQMRQGAEAFAQGNLDDRLQLRGSAELRALANTMNQMAAQLSERMRTVVQQRNEQEAMLASMMEGVLAVDTQEQVLRINDAASRMLAVSAPRVQGQPIQGAIRKLDLQRFVSRALESREPVEDDLVLEQGGEDTFLQAHGTRLYDASGEHIGALIVLNDVTRLRRLETMRRDFVANVSHELKTPLTAVKGFVETLQEGALEEPQQAKEFLAIVDRQVQRLYSIVEDLLELSRIEQEEEYGRIMLQFQELVPILERAVQACAMNAHHKGITLKLACAEDIRLATNGSLLEQALVNLIDNAIKYSDPPGRVEIVGDYQPDWVCIAVRDQGGGIAKEHLPRLFERFYRVDKARSREAGGTGLGLAIVKHIVRIHGGRIEVDSEIGQGSVFRLWLPQGSY